MTTSAQTSSHAFSPVLVHSACSNSHNLPLYAPSPKRPTRLEGITTRLLTGWQEARSGLARLGSGSHSEPIILDITEKTPKSSFDSDDSVMSEFQSIFRNQDENDDHQHADPENDDQSLPELSLLHSLSLDGVPLSPIIRTSNPLPFDQSFASKYQDLVDIVDRPLNRPTSSFDRRHTSA